MTTYQEPDTRTAGDTWRIPVDLKLDDKPVDVTGATVTFTAITTASPATASHAKITASSGDSGAAWISGRVVCVIPKETTLTFPAVAHRLEIVVAKSGEETTYLSDVFQVRKRVGA